MSNISLNLYRIFCVVAQCESYTEASEKLNLTISTISLSIKKLEELLDTKLFDRGKAGISITAEGRELFELIDEEIEKIDFAEKILMDKTKINNGNISIGCQSHIATYYMMDYIEKANKKYPNLKVNIIGNMNSDEMINILGTHKVDFLIMHIMPKTMDKKFKTKDLKFIENIFVSNKPIKISKVEEFNNYKYILSSRYTRTDEELRQSLKNHKIELKSNIDCDITEVRVEAAKRGIGIAYVMRDAVKKELKNKELYEVKVPIELPKFDIKLAYNRGQLTKVARSFINEYLES